VQEGKDRVVSLEREVERLVALLMSIKRVAGQTPANYDGDGEAVR